MKEYLKKLLSPASPWALGKAGIVGMNQRNIECILPNNPRRLYPRVDDKVLTKRICEEHGIPIPETYAIIDSYGDLRNLLSLVKSRSDFVVKPANGAAGRGIVVVLENDGESFVTAARETMSALDLRYHISSILTGLFSLGGLPDAAIIEQRIVRNSIFDAIAVRGTPDIRIILYRSVPIMGMVRLPTEASRGKANLHQGAIGAGIDLRTGLTLGGVCQNHVFDSHPDTGTSIVGFQIPHWQDILSSAIKLAMALELGYVGVDIVVDQNCGPIVLEANARPGLAIQVANRKGLLPRFRFVESLQTAPQSVEEALGLVEDVCRC